MYVSLNDFLPYIGIILSGVWITLLIAILSFLLGFTIGLLLLFSWAFSPLAVRKGIETVVDVIRGIPLLVMLFVVFYGFPALGVNLPSIPSAIIAMGILSGAYQSQIMRSLFQSISNSQYEAAISLGLTEWGAFVNVLVPQTLRLSIPGLVNEFTILLKDTSVAYAIGVTEMFTQTVHVAQAIYSYVIPLLFVSAIYLTMCLSLSEFASYLYKKYATSHTISAMSGGSY